jgi:hypothetical protein
MPRHLLVVFTVVTGSWLAETPVGATPCSEQPTPAEVAGLKDIAVQELGPVANALWPDVRASVFVPPAQTPKEADIDAFVPAIVNHKFLHSKGPHPASVADLPLQYTQFQNDCEYRAQMVVSLLATEHPSWVVGKVFVTGGLSVGTVGWGYHVAPFVISEGHHVRILDPAINEAGSLPIKDWLSYIGATSQTLTHVFFTSVFQLEPPANSTKLHKTPVLVNDAPGSSDFCQLTHTALSRLEGDQVVQAVRTLSDVVVESIDGLQVGVKGRQAKLLVHADQLPAFEQAKKDGRPVTVTYVSVEKKRLLGWMKPVADTVVSIGTPANGGEAKP